jgi:hypothetical protein
MVGCRPLMAVVVVGLMPVAAVVVMVVVGALVVTVLRGMAVVGALVVAVQAETGVVPAGPTSQGMMVVPTVVPKVARPCTFVFN